MVVLVASMVVLAASIWCSRLLYGCGRGFKWWCSWLVYCCDLGFNKVELVASIWWGS